MPPVCRARIVALALFLSLTALASPSLASPWTVQADELSLSLGFDFQSSSKEYLLQGKEQNFPLDGEFASSSVSLAGRYGFTNKFEGFFALTYKQAAYASNPLVRSFIPGTGESPDTSEQVTDDRTARLSLTNFSQSVDGVGDVFLGGRYSLRTGLIASALELQAKLPTGYDAPNGVNVTLGDAQVDLQPSWLLGGFLPQSRTFARLDVGYNLRLGAAGDQVVGGFKIGQFIGESFIVFAGTNAALTIFDGECVKSESGECTVNPVAIDADRSFETFNQTNIERQDLFLDRSFVRVEVGAILRIQQLDLQIAYARFVDGDNIPLIEGINVTSTIVLPGLTATPGEISATEDDGELEDGTESEDDEVFEEEAVVDEFQEEVVEPIEEEEAGPPARIEAVPDAVSNPQGGTP